MHIIHNKNLGRGNSAKSSKKFVLRIGRIIIFWA